MLPRATKGMKMKINSKDFRLFPFVAQWLGFAFEAVQSRP